MYCLLLVFQINEYNDPSSWFITLTERNTIKGLYLVFLPVVILSRCYLMGAPITEKMSPTSTTICMKMLLRLDLTDPFVNQVQVGVPK